MAIQPPSRDQLQRIAAAHHFELDDEELRVFSESIGTSLQGYERLAAMEEPVPSPASKRALGVAPANADNPYGGWAWKASIRETEAGPLAGKKIAIKDNVSVAGLPMRNGSALLVDHVPSLDATLVARILAAGGEIVGKAMCEDLCFSGGSHTSQPHPVLNPRNTAHMAGGSSSGSGALVASGACDMAIGGDQGGSIRIPSAWCGIFGLKPTWGLVPYTGAFPIEPSLDHVGPMATSVHDVALLLDAVAGRDGLDARQIDTPFELPNHVGRLGRGVRGLRIGILQEGFGSAHANADAEGMVKAAALKFQQLGCEVREVSVPMHHAGLDIWSGIATEGAWSTMVRDNAMGHGSPGRHDTALTAVYAKGRRERGALFSPTVKTVILLGAWLHQQFDGRFYGKSQNLRRMLRASYDAAFANVDLLLMPTTPQLPPKLIHDQPLADYLEVALNMMANTATFDATGHPAMSVPCGRIGDLPVGMMLVGRRFDEATILSAAFAFEQAGFAQLD